MPTEQERPGVRRFRKKPVVVDAVRWTGANIDDVLSLVDFDVLPPDPAGHVHPGVGHTAIGELEIPTLEGMMTARPGDWIIRGVEGELYPCKPGVFLTTYEQVSSLTEQERKLEPRVGLLVQDPEWCGHTWRVVQCDPDGPIYLQSDEGRLWHHSRSSWDWAVRNEYLVKVSS